MLKSKLKIKVIAFVLTLTTLVMSLPLYAYTGIFEAGDSVASPLALNSGAEETSEIYVLSENETLRDENTKHFLLSDGTSRAVVYSQAVHYRDDDGKWTDIDNTLTESGSEYSTDNKTKIKFANKSGSSGLVSINDGNYKIEFTPLGTNKVEVVIENPEKNNSRKFEDMSRLDGLTSKAIYANIYDGIDIEYILSGNNIKENIIVNEEKSSYIFSFELKLNGLTATLEDEKILLSDIDTAELIYEIPAPFMYDGGGEYSDAVTYTLTQSSKWKYTLTVEADAEWINTDGRAFPVTIDPGVSISGEDGIEDTAINSTMPDDCGGDDNLLAAGGPSIAYWRYANIPNVVGSAYIISAEFTITFAAMVKTGYARIGIYPVSSYWDEQTLSYTGYLNGQGEISSDVYSTVYGTDGELLGPNTWNVTDIVKSWYDGRHQNFGFAIKETGNDDSVNGYRYFSSEYQDITKSPRLVIAYKDLLGLEDYWSYTSQSVGLAGKGYINNATGHLTFAIDTMSTTDSLFSFSPALVYNQCFSKESALQQFSKASNVQMSLPCGFNLNMNEFIYRKQINSTSAYSYVWSDADGTEHSFYPIRKNGILVYEDNDGLLLTILEDEHAYAIIDLDGNQRIFRKIASSDGAPAILVKIADKNGNSIIFSRNSNYAVTSVSVIPSGSSEITYFDLTYTSASKLTKIVNRNTGRALTFYYNQITTSVPYKALARLIYTHEENGEEVIDSIVTYRYDQEGQLISAHDSKSGCKVEYSYTGNKISKVVEYYGENEKKGQTLTFKYYENCTEIRNSGADDIFGNSDDIINVYIFDESGRVASAYSMDSARTMIYGAVSGTYEEGKYTVNNIKTTNTVGSNASNYLFNGGFEILNEGAPLGWTFSSGVTYTNARFVNGGARAICFDTTSTGSNIKQLLYLDKGKYALSAQILTDAAAGVEVALKVVSLNNPELLYIEHISVNENESADTVSIATLPFTVEADGEYEISVVSVGSEEVNENALVIVDNLMLEKNLGGSRYSMVEFGGFEYAPINADGMDAETPEDYWTFEKFDPAVQDQGTLVEPCIVNTESLFNNSLCVQSGTAWQTVYRKEIGDNFENVYGYTFVLSAFAKATGCVADNNSSFAIKVEITYLDLTVSTETMEFSRGTKSWQFATKSFTTEAKPVQQIDVICEYVGNFGVAYFDDIYLSQSIDSGAVKNTYYTNGLLRSKNSGYYSEYYEYDDSNRLARRANDNGELVDYTYDEVGNLLTETLYEFTYGELIDYPHLEEDPDSLIVKTPKRKTVYTYNTYGQQTSSDTYEVEYDAEGNLVEKAGTKHITSSNEYITASGSLIFGALSSSTDTLGKTTRYFYDALEGYLLASVNPDGSGLCYTYDAIGNITSVRPAAYTAEGGYAAVTDGECVEYTYDEAGMLESIQTETTEYSFTYNVFGQREEVHVGSSEIASYEYNANNGKLVKIVYANGFSERYVYDELERVKEIWYSDGQAEEKAVGYSYNTSGQLYRYDNYINNTAIIYSYDLEGRMAGFVEFDTETNTNEIALRCIYNSEGLVSGSFVSGSYNYGDGIGSYELEQGYEYNTDGSLKKYILNTGLADGDVSYNYDVYDRLSEKTVSLSLTDTTDAIFVNTVNFEYLTVGNSTSALVSRYETQINSNGERVYTYAYDDSGNIISVTDSEGVSYRYAYDDLSQLIREDDIKRGYTFIYAYDDAGNIVSLKRYAIAAAGVEPTVLQAEIVFGYSNAAWGDQLTSVNGNGITYDALGNPLEYYNGYTFTWENGRRLASLTKLDGTVITYTYNDEGIRTSKTVNGVLHEYILNGSQIIGEQVGEHLYIYLYDAEGTPLGMQYSTGNSTQVFWFEKNLQGDIVAMYTDAGVKIATYEYNAWGNPMAIWRAEGYENIANANPFRYRGYYYDVETGLYYVSSRYYDPEIGRWINADNQIAGVGGEVLGYNMFAYCMNNPVNLSDPSGNWPKWATKLVAAVAVVAVVAVVAAVTVATAGAGTAIAAVAVGAAKGAAIGFAVGAATGAAGGAISHRISTGSWDGAGEAALNGMANGALSGAVSGAITGGITGGLSYNSGATSAGKGFDTYRQLKNEIGSPGAGNEWHHIVEQSQIAKSGFSPQMIQNTNNIMSISKTTHRAISGYYSSVQPFTNGMIVRNWLAGQSFSAQYEFGINVIKMFM